MKILYHHRIASKDGQYVHVSEIIRSLKCLEAHVTVVAPKMAEAQAFGGEVGFVSRLKALLPKALYELMEFCYAIIDFIKMFVAIIKDRPDIIYERYNLYFPSGVWASKCFHIPLILEINAPLFDERGKYGGLGLPGLARWTENYVWNHAHYVLPVTEVLACRVCESGVPRERMTVLHNGINREQFCQAVQRTEIPGRQAHHCVVGFVGFCREWHELDKVITLIANDESRQLFFVIVGDGPVLPQLKKQVAALDCEDRVHFTGLVERDAMPGWLAAIDIALQPAVVPYASPLKLIEYLATGKAIVAPSQHNICELLNHEKNALLFAEGNSIEFLAAIQRLGQDPILRETISSGAKATIAEKHLLWDENAKRIIALGEDLMKKQSVTAA